MNRFLLSTFLTPLVLFGEDLSKLVDISLQNQLIDSSKQNIQVIQEQYNSVKSNYLPRVTVGATYSNTNKETVSTPSSSIVSFANINYTIYDGGKKNLTFDTLDTNIKGAKENLTSLKNQLSLQVINYYYNYYSLLAQKEATQKQIEQLTAQYKRLQRFLEAGTTTSDEVDKIVSSVQNAKLTLHEAELNIQTVLHNLKYITSSNVKLTQGSTIDLDTLKSQENRADIKALEYDMKSSLLSAKATKSSNYPTISLDNTFNKYDMNYDNSNYDTLPNTQNVLKLNLTWKLYDFGATNSSYKSGYKQYQSIKSRYEYEKNKANVDLQLALKTYNIAKLKIDTAKLALKAATSTYETIQAKYQNGLVDNVAYLEALSEKYSAISGLKSAQYDLEIKKANIIYHSGKNVWEYIK